MKNLSSHLSSEKGLTLIEILASIVILSIIIVSLISFFVQSARSNSLSENVMDATYIAQTSMEEISNLISTSTSLANLSEPLVKKNGYTRVGTSGNLYEKTFQKHYIYIEITEEDMPLVKVKVKVYNDKSKSKLEAQMEMLLSWRQ